MSTIRTLYIRTVVLSMIRRVFSAVWTAFVAWLVDGRDFLYPPRD